MKRGYVINKYKGYSIRNHHFVPQANGGLLFETDDPDVQALIEGADGFGAFIFPRETAEELAQMKSVEEAAKGGDSHDYAEPDVSVDVGAASTENTLIEEQAPIAVQGARGTMAGRDQRKGQVIGAKRG